MDESEARAAERLLQRLGEVTVALICDVDRFPKTTARGSGFLVPHGADFLLLTAGHLFDKGQRWTLETAIAAEGGCFHAPLRELQTFAQVRLGPVAAEEVDLAWASIARADFLSALDDRRAKDACAEVPVYCGPLDTKPAMNELYAFAAFNRAVFDPNDATLIRERSYELSMTVRERDERAGTVTFDLARTHQGDAYYQGASGAPIADSQGRIVAVLCGPGNAPDTLWGTEIARFASVLSRQLGHCG